MDPLISEFSYGYALTDELIHWHGTSLTAAPVFPSLVDEGKPGGGYDLMLKGPGLPLFLQFKLSDCMIRNNSQEAKAGIFTTPYYRMHIRPTRYSQQHEMLLELENKGHEVYYSAPAFHTQEELNDAYLKHQVKERSLWLKPSEIGPLPDDSYHHVAFTIPGTHYFCSTPRVINARGDFQEFTDNIRDSYHQRSQAALTIDRLTEMAETIANIAQKRRDISPNAQQVSRSELKNRHPLNQIAFYSNVFFDCQLLIVREQPTPAQ